MRFAPGGQTNTIGPSISVSQQVCQAHHHKRHESAAWPNKACPNHRPHTAAAAARATRGHNAVAENAQTARGREGGGSTPFRPLRR